MAGFARLLADTLRLPNWPTVGCSVVTGYLCGLALIGRSLGPEVPVAPEFSPLIVLLLLVGAGGLYAMGCLLNDAVDAAVDARERPGRLVPSAAMSASAAANWGLGAGALGVLALFFIGPFALVVGAVLAVLILVYTWIHKRTVWGVLPMGLCRGALYPLGGLAAVSYWGKEMEGPLQWLIVAGLLPTAYVAGVSLVARIEGSGAPAGAWRVRLATGLMALPFFIPVLVLWVLSMRNPELHAAPLELLLFLMIPAAGLAWLAWARRVLPGEPGRFVGRALPGLVWIDALLLALFAPAVWLWMPAAALAAALVLGRMARAT